MAEELADEDLVDYEEDQDEGDDKGADEVKKCARPPARDPVDLRCKTDAHTPRVPLWSRARAIAALNRQPRARLRRICRRGRAHAHPRRAPPHLCAAICTRR